LESGVQGMDNALSEAMSWNKKITDPVLWPKIAMNCKKFRPFIEYEKDKYCDILRKRFS
jgi:hypothetical protein